ncbi:sulfate ABC transporter permease [Vibrio sp. WXL210]|uniref:sulfate ABC transporter permease n=1 Tax=Vibrio sp. WXL210 TaxID=3450709 RepID=UPI003EC60F21
MKKNIIYGTLCLLPLQTMAAIDLTDNLSVSGFGTTSWATSDNETPVLINRNIDDSNCFDCDTILGLQLDFYHEALKASAQVVKRPQDDWGEPELEWAYIGYEWDNFEAKVGRLRLPVFLKSEYFYVGHAYTYARPPSEVYDGILGITAFNGVSATWNHDFDTTTLTLTPFVGFKDSNTVDYTPTFRLEIETQYTVGLNSIITGENYRAYLTYLRSKYDADAILQVGPGEIPFLPFGGTVTIPTRDVEVDLYAAGFEYEFGQATLTFEAQASDQRQSWYSGAEYNVNKLTPYAIFGQQYSDSQHSNFRKAGNSFTLGARYDLLPNVSVNAEWQKFKAFTPYGGAFAVAEGAELGDDTDANVYTIMVNFVF